jgi:hypothetical protein
VDTAGSAVVEVEATVVLPNDSMRHQFLRKVLFR